MKVERKEEKGIWRENWQHRGKNSATNAILSSTIFFCCEFFSLFLFLFHLMISNVFHPVDAD